MLYTYIYIYIYIPCVVVFHKCVRYCQSLMG